MVTLNGQVDGGVSNSRAVFVDSGTAVTSLSADVRRGTDKCLYFPVKIQVSLVNGVQAKKSTYVKFLSNQRDIALQNLSTV